MHHDGALSSTNVLSIMSMKKPKQSRTPHHSKLDEADRDYSDDEVMTVVVVDRLRLEHPLESDVHLGGHHDVLGARSVSAQTVTTRSLRLLPLSDRDGDRDDDEDDGHGHGHDGAAHHDDKDRGRERGVRSVLLHDDVSGLVTSASSDSLHITEDGVVRLTHIAPPVSSQSSPSASSQSQSQPHVQVDHAVLVDAEMRRGVLEDMTRVHTSHLRVSASASASASSSSSQTSASSSTSASSASSASLSVGLEVVGLDVWVGGSVTVTGQIVGSRSFVEYSDRRLKRDIRPYITMTNTMRQSDERAENVSASSSSASSSASSLSSLLALPSDSALAKLSALQAVRHHHHGDGVVIVIVNTHHHIHYHHHDAYVIVSS